MKVLHIITCLARGGAESMLYKLVQALPASKGCEHVIISLTDGNEFDYDVLGVKVRSLGLKRGLPTPAALVRLRKMIVEDQPDLIHAWMYHSNIAASMAAGTVPVVWGVHHSLQDLKGEKPLTRWLIRGGAWLSRWPMKIIYCSQVSQRQHEQLGYAAPRSRFIPNGFDCDLFQPQSDAAASLRDELRVPGDALLVGHAARFHPIKNHVGLIAAFSRIAPAHPSAYLLLAGLDVDLGNAILREAASQSGCADRIKLLGPRNDMPRFYSGLDIFTLSSLSEGFPNVLGEAMACCTPCLSTDVGDAAYIIGGSGKIVPINDVALMAEGLNGLLSLPADARSANGAQARERIVSMFSIDSVAEQFMQAYRGVLTVSR